MGKQNQLLLKSTEVELGLQVGVEFDKKESTIKIELIGKDGGGPIWGEQPNFFFNL